MTEQMAQEAQGLSTLESLAAEARIYSESLAANMLQLGRVLLEAKEQVKHGAWSSWVRENAGCSERTAQQFMQVYRRFGAEAGAGRIEKSKLFKMLSLPEGEEAAFLEGHDVAAMSSRTVEAAVKEYRARAERAEAEAQALRDRPPEIPEDVQRTLEQREEELRHQQAALERARDSGQEGQLTVQALEEKIAAQARELRDAAELLEESQSENQRIQDALLNAQSAMARGEAGSLNAERFTAEVFGQAVRQFVGTCARMPQMGADFDRMDPQERGAYEEWLQVVEAFAADARRALNTVIREAEIV